MECQANSMLSKYFLSIRIKFCFDLIKSENLTRTNDHRFSTENELTMMIIIDTIFKEQCNAKSIPSV